MNHWLKKQYIDVLPELSDWLTKMFDTPDPECSWVWFQQVARVACYWLEAHFGSHEIASQVMLYRYWGETAKTGRWSVEWGKGDEHPYHTLKSQANLLEHPFPPLAP